MMPAQDETTESALSALLDSLALALIKLGVTPARLTQIARTSFVKAGATYARKRSSGLPHLARIAALTGIPRSEVKRIVSSGFAPNLQIGDSVPRAVKVLRAWRSSNRYSSRGKPRELWIVGRAPSFVELCREFSGDIPYRVILDELKRDGLVAIDSKKKKVSAVDKVKVDVGASATMKSLSYAATFLERALREDALLLRKRQRVRTTSTLPTPYIEAAISGRIAELLDQFPNMFPITKRRTQDYVDVFAMVARTPRTKKK